MLAFFGGYGALLCNYGNGASIYIFGNGYVSQKDWYLKGTILLAMILRYSLLSDFRIGKSWALLRIMKNHEMRGRNYGLENSFTAGN